MHILSKRNIIFAISPIIELDQRTIDDLVSDIEAINLVLKPYAKIDVFQSISRVPHEQLVVNKVMFLKVFKRVMDYIIALDQYIPSGSKKSYKNSLKREIYPFIDKAISVGILDPQVRNSLSSRLDNVIESGDGPTNKETIDRYEQESDNHMMQYQ